MSEATHIAKVLAYCKQHGSITVRDAAVVLDINSPTKVISNMRKSDKYDVSDIQEERVDGSGVTKRYKRYFIRAVES